MAKQKTQKDVSDEEILEAIAKSKNVAEAVTKTTLTFNAFKYRAMKLGAYAPSMKGAGKKVSLYEILEGKHPHFQTFKLRNRLIREGIFQNTCEECGVGPNWNGKEIQCQLDHKDGDRFNHRLTNLRMLCPNCHSQTETFSGKNK